MKAERRGWPAYEDPDHVEFLPALNADVVVRGHGAQIIMECKFARVFTQHKSKTMIDPNNVRQLVSYATVFRGEFAGQTRAVLLGALVDGSKGRDLEFAIDEIAYSVRQIDLSKGPAEIRAALMESLNLGARSGAAPTMVSSYAEGC